MSKEAERKYLSRVFTRIGVDLPVKMPNLAFDIPKNAPYGEFHIMGTKPFVVGGAGENKIVNRYVGMVQLNIWIPEGKGTKGAAEAGDKFAKMFAHKSGRDTAGSNYVFKGAETINPDVKNAYTVQVVRIPFHRDTIESVGETL
ncbi:hypothetical protein LAV_00014 [Sphingobium phage Lacusarx]|uniref:Uncharacterized protein n=1 Tax=Sphingobium phage Lacusarx TaxID=1980139 RepID=A0A1W6DWY7_9CAUD|nr:tail terminator [Sphingobium phage Lacusarx]ARK07414.1 hypothetical protein LAV_00014 [Sphingobium phage Lacusarx]